WHVQASHYWFGYVSTPLDEHETEFCASCVDWYEVALRVDKQSYRSGVGCCIGTRRRRNQMLRYPRRAPPRCFRWSARGCVRRVDPDRGWARCASRGNGLGLRSWTSPLGPDRPTA